MIALSNPRFLFTLPLLLSRESSWGRFINRLLERLNREAIALYLTVRLDKQTLTFGLRKPGERRRTERKNENTVQHTNFGRPGQ